MPRLSSHVTITGLNWFKAERAGGERSAQIHFWELDFDVLLGQASEVTPAIKAVHHTTAKIVLVGDSGVGKTGLGWRLAHGEYKEHSSTHGQQFWVVDALGTRRKEALSVKRFSGIWQDSLITV